MAFLRKLFGMALLLIAVFVICVLLLSTVNTLRYPRLTFDPKPQPEKMVEGGFHIEADGAYLKSKQGHLFRAFSPSVSLLLANFPEEGVTVTVENIHPDAVLETHSVTAINRGYITEIVNGLSREVHISAPGSRVDLTWRFPKRPSYLFGVMGDTGGNRELDWGLQRLAEFRVDFILHLGDLYYYPDEIGPVHQRLNQSEVPVYATIGNHDFHGPKGNTHDIFSQNIGPLNAAFRLLDSCFINIDTAADMFPADKGYRAKFLDNLGHDAGSQLAGCEKIVYTHKPFTDGLTPDLIPNQGHSMQGYQADSIRKWFAKTGKLTLLSGHIHDDLEFSLPGIKTYVAGSGLAVKDLIAYKTSKAVQHEAKYLLGQIQAGQAAEFSWVSGDMPLEYHCSRKVWRGLKKSQPELLSKLQQLCGS